MADEQTPIRVFLRDGDTIPVVLPHSEVCMHMRVAGKLALVTLYHGDGLQTYAAAQIRFHDSELFSAAVTPGEAGLYYDETRKQYYGYLPTLDQYRAALWITR